MRRGQRTFQPDNKKDRHTYLYLRVFIYLKIGSKGPNMPLTCY